MDSGYYAAMTGLVARFQALDTAASNLANASTPGFRAEREFFRSALLGPDALDSQLGRTVNNYGLLGGDQLSMTQGALEQTGNPLDLAIEGQGFFEILTANGTVNVISQVEVSQPNALSSGGTTQVVQQTQVQAEEKPVNRIDLKEGATVEDLVQELQRTGAGARDVISILQAMKEAGALEADLEVI